MAGDQRPPEQGAPAEGRLSERKMPLAAQIGADAARLAGSLGTQLSVPLCAAQAEECERPTSGKSSMSEQILFGTNDFAVNPEPRLPCVLLLDVSGSMSGTPISELNSGLAAYRDALVADALAAKRVEVAIVTFGGQVQTACDFTTVEGFHPPTLVASGDTPMGAAISTGLEMVRQRKNVYKQNGISRVVAQLRPNAS
jgi:hypothetical protein